jgi:AraC-like DNA-binding protein
VRYPQLGDNDWLRQRYVADRTSVRDIAAEVGCTERTMRRVLAAAGLARRGRSRFHQRRRDHDWLRLRYLVQQVTLDAVACELGSTGALSTRHWRRRASREAGIHECVS